MECINIFFAKMVAQLSIERSLYVLYEKIAKKEGLIELKNTFADFEDQNRIHIKCLLRMANADEPLKTSSVDISVPMVLADSESNIQEILVRFTQYLMDIDSFLIQLKDPGKPLLCARMKALANALNYQAKIFESLLSDIQSENNADVGNSWLCLKCGYVHQGDKLPEKCPWCLHPKHYFSAQ